MKRLFKFIIRSSSFIGKEIAEILRQTRLLLALVLGPFLIMLIFGIGYRNEPLSLRTLFVIHEGNPYREEVERFAKTMGETLVYQGIRSDTTQALNELSRGQTDLVVVVPDDAYQTIRGGEQATFQIYHNEIDPNQANYVEYFGNSYVDEVNKRVLRAAAVEGQTDAENYEARITSARQRIRQIRSALQSGQTQTAQEESAQLGDDLDAITMLVGGSLNLLQGLNQTFDVPSEKNSSQDIEAIQNSLNRIQQQREFEALLPGQGSDVESEIERLDQTENNLDTLENQLVDFQSIPPQVLVAPFNSQTSSIEGFRLTPIGFFAPAVIVLLLQHLATTFSALSIVRERRSGAMELFRISPLSAFEILVGKYWSYMLYGVFLAAIITVTVVFILNVPMFGMWVNYILAVLGLLFTSLGMGFLISLLSETDTQAVQYAMFFLLASVFFSGFFLDLRYLRELVKIISWALPATYGIQSLHDIMLRGIPPNGVTVSGLFGMGLIFFTLAWLLLRHQMSEK